MKDLTIAVILFGLLFLSAGAFGFCTWCKKWVEPENDGEYGYVADVEHDNSGKPETGFWLQWSRVWETIGTPLCLPVNKFLGRLKK